MCMLEADGAPVTRNDEDRQRFQNNDDVPDDVRLSHGVPCECEEERQAQDSSDGEGNNMDRQWSNNLFLPSDMQHH